METNAGRATWGPQHASFRCRRPDSGIFDARGIVNEALKVGETFLGKYRIEKLVGNGGMGAVYAATDIDLERKVAIKVLLPEIAGTPGAAARFVREGKAAGRLEGEHVARVYAAGKAPDGLPYIILELLEGIDLAGLLQVRGKLDVAEAAGILCQALEGVAEAHHHGVVHRDLKPANIFLHHRRSGAQVVKVLDFGLSKLEGAQASGQGWDLTTTAMLGSPYYASPEQLRDSKNVDGRTDIWALGVILYEMLAGVPPFRDPSLPGIVSAILHGAIPPLGALRPDVPAGLTELIARCLERNLDQRLGDVMELRRQLAPFAAAADDTQKVPASVETLEPQRPAPAPTSAPVHVWPPPPQALKYVVVALALLVPAVIMLLGGVVLFFVLRSR